MFSCLKSKALSNSINIIFCFSIILWLFSFRGFFLNKIMITSDAQAYYDHVKFYLLNITRGAYPLWEHFRQGGVPAEFFMRRIGSFNPLFFIVFVLYKIGLSFPSAYVTFLGLYYLTGMIGFYFLAKKVLRDSTAAFVAYLLLTFSALGTRIFDSYFNLVLIPMIWFFYFLIAFVERQEKCFLLGLTFTAMILFSTYIPFYFLTIFLLFLVCYVVFYFRNIKIIPRLLLQFSKKNKVFVCFCAFAVVLSLVPGIILQQSLGKEKAEVVLPRRHYNYEHTPSPGSSQLSVDIQTIIKWGIMEDIMYSVSFSDLRNFHLAIFYMPIFAYLIFLLGVFTRINKKLAYFFVFAFLVLILGAPHKVSFHNFIREHIFYFKYFRNLHFFLWLVLLPLFVLFLAEQFRLLINYKPSTNNERIISIAFLTLIHVGVASYLWARGDAIISSFLVVGLSFIFFALHFSGKLKAKRSTVLFILLILIAMQPLEVYHYLAKNSPKMYFVDPYGYGLANNFLSPLFGDASSTFGLEEEVQEEELPASFIAETAPSIYMGTVWYYKLVEKLRVATLHKYIENKILLYDRVEFVDDLDLDFERIGWAFERNQNLAFVSGDEYKMTIPTSHKEYSPHAQIVKFNSEQIKHLGFNGNYLKLKTNFDTDKFLVFNDGFHSEWQAFIDGQKVDLWRANIAFKGLWVPKGEHIVYFRYGALWRYVFNYFLVFLFLAVFIYLIVLTRRYVCTREHGI